MTTDIRAKTMGRADSGTLIRIDAPHFCAGIELDGDGPAARVIRAAPILRYMTGWPRARAVQVARRNGWAIIALA
jgi:hypothetical protein